MEKQCSKCGRKKKQSDFYKAKRYKDGRYPSCKVCCAKATEKSIIKKWGTKQKYYAEYRNRIKGGNPRIIFAKKKCNALSHNIPFKIKVDEFVDWYEKQDLKCAYCDIPQDKITEYQWLMPNINTHRLTIDRIDNSRGYIKGNICLACARCNLIKSNVLSFNEAREIGQRYVKPKWKN